MGAPCSRPRRCRGSEVDPGDKIALVVSDVRKLLPAVALSPGIPEEGSENCGCYAALQGCVNLRPPPGEAVAVAPVPPAIVAGCCSVEALKNFFCCVCRPRRKMLHRPLSSWRWRLSREVQLPLHSQGGRGLRSFLGRVLPCPPGVSEGAAVRRTCRCSRRVAHLRRTRCGPNSSGCLRRVERR